MLLVIQGIMNTTIKLVGIKMFLNTANQCMQLTHFLKYQNQLRC